MSVGGSIDLNSTNGECIYFEYHLLNCKSGTGVQVTAHKKTAPQHSEKLSIFAGIDI